jgi:O-antigen/teichoic acid export membrane protein
VAEASAQERPRLLRSGLLTYGTSVGAAALGLVNVLVMARALGPAGRGDVAFLTTMAFLTAQLASFGVDQANVNFAGRDQRLGPSLATNSLLMAGVLGALAAGAVALLVLIVPAAGGDVSSGQRWLVLGALPALIFNIFAVQLVAARYRFVVMNAAYLLPPVLNATINGALALTGVLSVTLAVLVWVGGQLLATALVVGYMVRRVHGFGRPDGALARRMLGFGVRAHGGRVMLLGNYRLDQWILGGISGSTELGLYSVAVAWSEGLFFLPNALASVQRPDLVRAERGRAGEEVASAFRVVTLITIVLAVLLFALAPVLCKTIFGPKFGGSVDDLRLLVLGGFGIAALKMFGSALTAQRRPLLETAAVGVAFVAIVVLDVVLIPAHGGVGAAIASSLAYLAGGVAVVWLFTRTLGVRVTELIPRPRDAVWVVHRLRPGGRE